MKRAARSGHGMRSPLSDASSSKVAAERAGEIQRVIAILHQWGIHSLGQFAAFKKEDVSLRLGTEALRMWERANGKSMRLLKLVQSPESFAETFEFEHEIETVEPLLFMLRRFLEQLTLRLGALYFVARDLKLRLTFSDKKSYEHRFKIPEPSNNLEVLFRMLHAHLENFTAEAPITSVSLEAEPAKPGQQQFSLFETALRDPAQLSETLAHLTGLLGEDCVGTPVLEDTHRPDSFRIESFAWELPNEQSEIRSTVPFALRRFRAGTPAALFVDQSKSKHLRSVEVQSEVTQHSGPFMASGNWWDEKSWARTEWDVQLAEGALCRCHQEKDGWQLDGIYD